MEIKQNGSQPSGRAPGSAVLEHLDGRNVDWMEKVSDEEYEAGESAE
jgi:hypothetical protein